MSREEQPPTGPGTARERELRRMLVATASAAPAPPRRRNAVMISVAAFALSGALTGGAVSAAALNAPPAAVDVDDLRSGVIHDDTRVLGTPFTIEASGTTSVEAGRAPEAGAELAVALHCVTPGTFDLFVDEQPAGRWVCDAGATGGFFIPVSGAGPHMLTVETAESNEMKVWAAWAMRPVPPAPSEAQAAALADGVVTEAEYRDGFARYRECMQDAGHPLIVHDEAATVIEYSSPGAGVASGDEGRCYALEFDQLDVAWQLINEYDSPTQRTLRACLEEKGITPGGDVATVGRQLEEAGIDVQECLSAQP